MANDTERYILSNGFRPYGSNSLFLGAIVVSLCIHAFTVARASAGLAKDVDVTQLAIVDVKKAQIEMQRELAARAKKEPPKPKAPAKKEKLPPPAPPKATEILRVKPPPVAVPISGQRINAGRGSQRGIEMPSLGVGGQTSGSSVAGFGVHPGATGAGNNSGAGPAVPTAAPPPPTRVEEKPVTAPPPPRVEEKPVAAPPPPPPPVHHHENRVADKAYPTIVSAPQPEPPSFLGEEGGQGTVTVEFTVEADGSISNVRVVDTTDRRLDAAAIAAAKRIRATPATQDGIPRAMTMTRTYQFIAQ